MDSKIERAMFNYIQLYLNANEEINYEELGSGHIFSRVLLHAQGLKFVFGEFRENPSNWIHKLSNIKLIIRKASQYFEYKLGKGIRTTDINLIQIAKNNKKSEIIKLFEIVLACLTEAPNKEEHISKMTNLEQQSQKTFVWLIHKVIQNRIIELQNYRKDKDLKNAQQLQFYNTLLQNQIDSILQNNTLLQKQCNELQNRIQREDDVIEIEGTEKEERCYKYIVQNQELKNLVESLKKKIEEGKHQHEQEVSRLTEQINILNARTNKLQEVEETLQLYKQQYNQMQIYAKNNKKWQKQSMRLTRMIAQRDESMRKIQEKLDIAVEKNYQHEEREVYLLMEMQKKQVRFRELEKQVKKIVIDSTQSFSLTDNTLHSLRNLDQTQPSLISDEFLENKQLKQQLDALKRKNRQNEREINKLLRKIQRIQILQKQKKKLEKMVVDAHTFRTEELELLVTTLSETHSNSTTNKKKEKPA